MNALEAIVIVLLGILVVWLAWVSLRSGKQAESDARLEPYANYMRQRGL